MLDNTGSASICTEVDTRSAQQSKNFYCTAGKRVLDVLFSVCALVLVSPLILLAAVVISFDGHPPFYRQQRVGMNGRTFTIYKLRSMCVNADERLEEHLADNPEARAEWDETQKLRNDPRITPVGRIIRKTSIDELPQFLNVLLGDMSVVGPRPITPEQKSMYGGTAYYAMRPGITGPWQVGDRNLSSFADRSRYDEDYHGSITFLNDTRMVLKTLHVVARGTGL